MTLVTVLAGGVGAARFLEGLIRLAAQDHVTIIGNTGDDVEFYGLRICPDLDIVTYTLAGVVDAERGWGIRNDTNYCQQSLAGLGFESWFWLGDRDMATHIYRTSRLREGATLTEVTGELTKRFGLRVNLIPMSNDRVETRIITDHEELNFQEYFVKRHAQDAVRGVKFLGAEEADPSPGVIDSIRTSDHILIAPSNPAVSIGPILAIKGIRQALRENRRKTVGISPIIAGAPVKGPADKLMAGLGQEVSAYGVAQTYVDIMTGFIIDSQDKKIESRIKSLGVNVAVTDTLMRSLDDKVRVAKTVLDLAKNLATD